jgi:hypothetical protein
MTWIDTSRGEAFAAIAFGFVAILSRQMLRPYYITHNPNDGSMMDYWGEIDDGDRI